MNTYPSLCNAALSVLINTTKRHLTFCLNALAAISITVMTAIHPDTAATAADTNAAPATPAASDIAPSPASSNSPSSEKKESPDASGKDNAIDKKEKEHLQDPPGPKFKYVSFIARPAADVWKALRSLRTITYPT